MHLTPGGPARLRGRERLEAMGTRRKAGQLPDGVQHQSRRDEAHVEPALEQHGLVRRRRPRPDTLQEHPVPAILQDGDALHREHQDLRTRDSGIGHQRRSHLLGRTSGREFHVEVELTPSRGRARCRGERALDPRDAPREFGVVEVAPGTVRHRRPAARHQHQGGHFEVKIDVHGPGKGEVVINRQHAEDV